MGKKRVVILGGGISGLSLAFYLSKYSEHLDIVLLEKSDRLGGWMRTARAGDFLFERGPHTFSTARSQLLRELAIDVGLENEIIFSEDSAKKRYLYLDGELKGVPKWPLLKSLVREWRTPYQAEDESVYAFASRRFSKQVAELLFDPLTTGIYAGDARVLSVRSCFPFFKKMEERYGSLTLGMLATCFKRKKAASLLFTFQEGVESLVKALGSKIEGEIHLETEVKALCFMQDGVEVQVDGKVWKADHIFCALPSDVAGPLFASHDFSLEALFDIPKAHVSIVNFGYSTSVLPERGFGYLVPTFQKQEILGVIFDSCIFPQQNGHREQTRLTVLMRKNVRSIEIAQEVLKKHLNITKVPDAVLSTDATIPQYYVGHAEKIKKLQAQIQNDFPRVTLLGNYQIGVSVNDCLKLSKQLSDTYKEKIFLTTNFK
ncbi:MAG: protoporphyrinogen oxidase [Chlamydiota bacterium]